MVAKKKKQIRCDGADSKSRDHLCHCQREQRCADTMIWPDRDDAKCAPGSCMALVMTNGHGHRCDQYCASFNHVCTGAFEEVDDTCAIKEKRNCDGTYADTPDMICKCEQQRSLPPLPRPAPQPPAP